jgi:tetratricopeptide (TPR) repeat protein
MKRFILIIFLALSINKSVAQRLNTDSLWQVVESTKNDSIRLLTLSRLTNIYNSISIDSNINFNSRLVKFSQKLNSPKYNALAILYSSWVYTRIGDYQKVQEHIAKAALISEQIQDSEVMATVEYYKHYNESNPYKKIEFIRRAVKLRNALVKSDPRFTIMLGNLSTAYLATNQIDSAYFYAQRMYENSIKYNDTASSFITGIMGNMYLKMNQPEIAYAFFKKGLKFGGSSASIGNVMRAYIPMANYFEKTNQLDSALYYWKKPFEYNPKELFVTKLNASKHIYNFYLKKGINDSAVKYMNFYIMANDSVNSTNKIAQLQAARFEDELRQLESEKSKQSEIDQRNHNIQLAITAIAILTAIILFLLLSRSILVSHKVVEFLSVIVLLVVFEFINLLIHPFLEKITHHSPVLMLLALVAIAALIVPFHHRLEHWTTKILVEKNKAIRLAKAKQTIRELEADNPNS